MNKIAYVFPGQGSQSVGMLAELAAEYAQVQDTFAQASEALGYDLWDVSQHDTHGQLNKTEVTQPALLTASVAIFRILQATQAASADVMAGHSLGEYSALVCADVLSLTEAVRLVQARGQYMQQAVPEGSGAMYAIIGLDDAKIEQICAEVAEASSQVIAPVNYNSPGQVVIAGSNEAAGIAATQCKDAGAKRVLPLAVSVPSHCALMLPAADKLRQALAGIQLSSPKIDVINNVDVAANNAAADIADALVRQLHSPVRWTETIHTMLASGVSHFCEVGPGKVLSGLIKRIDRSVTCTALNTPVAIQGLSQ